MLQLRLNFTPVDFQKLVNGVGQLHLPDRNFRGVYLRGAQNFDSDVLGVGFAKGLRHFVDHLVIRRFRF